MDKISCGFVDANAAKQSASRNHERIGSVLKKAADPVLKPTATRKLRANNFVLAKYEKQGTHCNSKTGKSLGA